MKQFSLTRNKDRTHKDASQKRCDNRDNWRDLRTQRDNILCTTLDKPELLSGRIGLNRVRFRRVRFARVRLDHVEFAVRFGRIVSGSIRSDRIAVFMDFIGSTASGRFALYFVPIRLKVGSN